MRTTFAQVNVIILVSILMVMTQFVVPRYALLHLHPLRSRVTDMEHKLKVAMDTLVTRLKITSSKRTPPGLWHSYKSDEC